MCTCDAEVITTSCPNLNPSVEETSNISHSGSWIVASICRAVAVVVVVAAVVSIGFSCDCAGVSWIDRNMKGCRIQT